MSSNNHINDLVKIVSRLPGLGPRSARRLVLKLLQNKESMMQPLVDVLDKTMKSVVSCELCGNFCSNNPCLICSNKMRDAEKLCVVETVADLWAIERSSSFKGHYHVLGGVLSAINGVTPDKLNLDTLIGHIKRNKVEEVILALSATIDGQTTAHYIIDMIEQMSHGKSEGERSEIKITLISHGVPIGGELDYLDDGTLSTAINSRRAV